ncbi:Protein VPS-39 c [Aphelenchoides avenae]|nr:Protein VPS-39 c [Aphelenchus avenae]
MYDAYVAEEVAKKLPFDATCIASHSKSEKLLVGSKSGALVFCQPNKEKRGFDYQACKTFERRAIAELKVVEEEDLIMCLTDSQVNVHSVDESFTTVHSLNRYKPVTAFAFYYDKREAAKPTLLPNQGSENNARLLVILCARKRFYLFELADDEFRELELSLSPPYLVDNAQAICWCGPNAVVFAARSEYFYVAVRTDLQEAQIADEGTLGEVQPLNVSVSAPEVPLLVSLLDRDVVGIYKDHQVMFITSSGHASEDMPKCRFSDSLVALAYDAPYLIGLSSKHVVEIRSISPPLLIQKISLNRAAYLCIGSSGSLYVGSERMAWKLDSKPTLNANLKLLLDERQFELALSLVQRNNDVEPKLATEIRRRFAYHLFAQKKFHECFTMHAEMGTEVLFVLYFTRHLIPIPDEFSKLISENERKEELRLFEAKVELAHNEWKSAVLALGDYLSAKRTEFARRLEMHRKGGSEAASKNALLSPKDLQACEKNLRLVDTVLLKCYIQTKKMMVPSLLRLPDNSCMLEEAENDLRSSEMWSELFLLFELLELLKAEAHRRESEFYGPEHAASYLYQLGPESAELIFKHASWIIRENMDIGLQVFVSSKSKAARDMNQEEVLKFLKKECVAAIPLYLERLVYDWGEKRPKFHELLKEIYIIQIKDLLKNNVKVLKDNEYFVRVGADDGPLGQCRENLVRFLRFSKDYNAQTTLDLLDFAVLFLG